MEYIIAVVSFAVIVFVIYKVRNKTSSGPRKGGPRVGGDK